MITEEDEERTRWADLLLTLGSASIIMLLQVVTEISRHSASESHKRWARWLTPCILLLVFGGITVLFLVWLLTSKRYDVLWVAAINLCIGFWCWLATWLISRFWHFKRVLTGESEATNEKRKKGSNSTPPSGNSPGKIKLMDSATLEEKKAEPTRKKRLMNMSETAPLTTSVPSDANYSSNQRSINS